MYCRFEGLLPARCTGVRSDPAGNNNAGAVNAKKKKKKISPSYFITPPTPPPQPPPRLRVISIAAVVKVSDVAVPCRPVVGRPLEIFERNLRRCRTPLVVSAAVVRVVGGRVSRRPDGRATPERRFATPPSDDRRRDTKSVFATLPCPVCHVSLPPPSVSAAVGPTDVSDTENDVANAGHVVRDGPRTRDGSHTTSERGKIGPKPKTDRSADAAIALRRCWVGSRTRTHAHFQRRRIYPHPRHDRRHRPRRRRRRLLRGNHRARSCLEPRSNTVGFSFVSSRGPVLSSTRPAPWRTVSGDFSVDVVVHLQRSPAAASFSVSTT